MIQSPKSTSNPVSDADRASHGDASARSCPICGGRPAGLAFPYETIWEGARFLYRGCASCGTTFVDPVPTDEQLRAIYAWGSYHAHHYTAPVTAEPDRYKRSLDFLAASANGRRTILDFGCGDGSFLRAAREAGYQGHGVEYEESTIAAASERAGVPVSTLDALEESGKKFQIVHMNDVLPHLTDPVGVMRRLEKLLASDGFLFMEGPLENNASLVFYASTMVKRLRRRLGLDVPAKIAPTMLMRLNRSGQTDWFTQRLGYTSVRFEIYETGWPYFVAGQPPASLGGRLKQTVGALAVAAAGWEKRPEKRRLGNRFMAILTAPR